MTTNLPRSELRQRRLAKGRRTPSATRPCSSLLASSSPRRPTQRETPCDDENPVDPNGAYSSAPDDLLEKARRELEEALDAAELGRCTGYAAPEPEPKDEWEAFLRDVTRYGLGPRVTPRRGWVLAGGPALRPGHDRRAVAVALEVRAPGSTLPHLLTVPLVRTPLILDYLSGRGFLCPAERLLDPIDHPFEQQPGRTAHADRLPSVAISRSSSKAARTRSRR